MANTTPNNVEVLNLIRELPGITAREIYTFMPDVPKGTVSSSVTTLKSRGLIVEDGKKVLDTGSGPRPFPAYRESDNPLPPVKRLKLKKPTEAGLQARLDAANKLIEELQAWKADALRRFPELGVDPIVLRARSIVASALRAAGDPTLADLVTRGAKDETMLVKVTVKALEEADV
jgi:hypothetical protein